MKQIGFMILLATLAGCGVDGEPIRPSMTTYIGVGGSGTHVGTQVSVSKGNMTIGVGLGR